MIQASITTKKEEAVAKEVHFQMLPLIGHDIVYENKSYKILEITHYVHPHHSIHLLVKEN